ncbi:hypothetical protein FQN57_002788 [Myotisia sp. PD_48]|nr:hypothetical protein FQN57_002788 [Myotisia sp. PD_48]
MHDELTISSLISRSGGIGGDPNSRPPAFKAVGISLAVASGVFIGISFVLKKVGLLKANVKYNEEAGEGYGYLKNVYWWGGMILMILGEICNFVAYAFVDAILVTPLGALSVVVTTVLSAIFLKERLSFVGKVGCFNCLVGSVVIAMNAPSQSSVTDIQDMKEFVIHPAFLSFAGVIIAACTFIALWAGPRYGKKSMFVYLTICSLIGGLSVVATQGLGAAIVAQISGKSQFKEWFLYVLLAFVIGTLITEIIYLNKALNIFNAALVTPTYYVIFTSATIITSAVLFQGFKGSAMSITTVVMGFLQICTGVVLLQLSKSAKDVPDAAIFKGDLDQVRQVAEQEQPELDPKADSIRGTAAIIRRISTPRRKMELDEVMRFRKDQRLDQLETPAENEVIEWDGLRRRKTVVGNGPSSVPRRTKTLHPPLGMSHFPDDTETEHDLGRNQEGEEKSSFLGNLRRRASSLHPYWQPLHQRDPRGAHMDSPISENPENRSQTEGILMEPFKYNAASGRPRSETIDSDALEKGKGGLSPLAPSEQSSPPTPPPHSSLRQFSFRGILNREPSSPNPRNTTGGGVSSRLLNLSPFTHYQRRSRNPTEEESLGLVQGDNSQHSHDYSPEKDDERSHSYTPEPSSRVLHRSDSMSSSASSMDSLRTGDIKPIHHPSSSIPASAPPQPSISNRNLTHGLPSDGLSQSGPALQGPPPLQHSRTGSESSASTSQFPPFDPSMYPLSASADEARRERRERRSRLQRPDRVDQP